MSAITYHLERIKAEADLIAIIGKDTHLTKKGSGPRGVEYSGECPICHGAKHDGFIVQPENKPYPTWFCRKHTGPAALSAIDYVAQRRGYDPKRLTREELSEIVHTLAGDAAATTTGPVAPRAREIQPVKLPPAQAWQTSAQAYIEYAERQLWTPTVGAEARAYLHSRGLTDDTIKRYRLGYNPQAMKRPAEKWGTPNDNPEPLTLWAGIVIPWIVGGEVWAINTRQMGDVDPKDRYKKVRGSRAAIFNADALECSSVALYVEGELDAVLAQQEAGGTLAVVTLGGSGTVPDPAVWTAHYYAPNLTMFLPDNDEAGWESFGKFAAKELARFLVAVGLPTNDKDLGDFYRAGGDVKAWIADTLQAHDPAYFEIATLADELGATVREL